MAAPIASAGAPEGSWYVAPEVYALWLDDDRQADDDIGIGFAFGRTFTANWDLELGIVGSRHDRAGNGTLDLNGYSLNLKRVFYREGPVNPFISVGLGLIDSRPHPGENDSDFSGQFGVGLLIDLGGDRAHGSAMQLRGDLGGRRGLLGDANAGDKVDYFAGIGIQYNWGGVVARKPVDSDGDGVMDEGDRCPGTAAGTPVDSAGCPVPQDDDGDGVVNENDKCPGTPAGKKVDAAGCEVDGDDDGDGILNSVDQCPNSPAGSRVNNAGCPFDRALVLQGVKFATNSDQLLPDSLPVLENAIATLKRYPEVKIEVAGHTDSRGSDAYNLGLSARRAAAVLTYLRNGGVTNAMSSHGYGEADPIASNDTDEGRQQNRRVVLRALN